MYTSGFDKVSEIVCSDFLEANRNYIKRIISGTHNKTTGLNWERFTEQAYGKSNFVQSFRTKCQQVAFVDMSDESGKGFAEIEESGQKFDLITSEFAFCEGTRDLTNYEDVIAK